MLITAGRIKSGDFDSWYEEWNRIAEKVGREAADQLARGHRISARDSFLRAATYYCASEFFLNGNPGDPRVTSANRKSVECYEACAKVLLFPACMTGSMKPSGSASNTVGLIAHDRSGGYEVLKQATVCWSQFS